MIDNPLLIIASGGGHTGFARAIAEYLPFKPDFVIPEDDQFSKDMLLDYARKLYYVKKGKDPGQGNITLMRNFLKIIIESGKIPKYLATIATGSNHSLIPAMLQKIKGSTLYVTESQDRIITRGKTVSVLSKFSRRVFLHWNEQKGLYDNGVVVGPIVEKPKYKSENKGYILVTTGSMGFKKLFDSLLNLRGNYKFVIQTGKVDPTPYIEKKPDWSLFSFDKDIERYIANAELVITHQGKTAMESVVMYGKPTIIVYNKDWKSATTKQDTILYAKILGATFLDDPSTWDSIKVLEDNIQNVRKPKQFEIGTPKLIDIILSELAEFLRE
ncbi:polysaccharide biosynthesis protein [Sulfolobus acidocaldarius SUSAZ]|nr:polysaccharide biosynthesis protein [Sulfolobus acidocaldarius SUSAZ]